MSSKAKGKSDKPASNSKVDLMEIIGDINHRLYQADDVVRKAEHENRDAQAALASAHRQREFLRERLAEAMTGGGVPAALECQPYDADLHDLLAKTPALTALAGGASDEQIRKVLSTSWHPYASPDPGRTSCNGGKTPAVWINPKSYSEKPTLEGQKLIAAVRRVLRIPLPVGGQTSAKKKPAAKSKRSGDPDASGSAKTAKSGSATRNEQSATGNSLPGFRPQTFGQWKATVIGCLGNEGDLARGKDDKLRQLFDAKNIKPGEAARMLKDESKDESFDAGPNRVPVDPFDEFDDSTDQPHGGLPGKDAGEVGGRFANIGKEPTNGKRRHAGAAKHAH